MIMSLFIFRYTLPGKFMSDPIEARFGWYRQASGGNFFMSVKQLMLAEKKIRALSLLQQKMLVEASKFTSSSFGVDFATSDVSAAADIQWLYDFFVGNEVGDLNQLSIVDGNVIYFVSGYIARSICRRRKCVACQVQLLAAVQKEERIEEFIPDEYKALFDDANRGGLSAPTELCFATTALAVQAYNAISTDDETKMKLLTGNEHRAVFAKALHRLASSTSAAVLNQQCSQQHENFDSVVQAAFNCFAKNELKRLNCKKADPPAKMQRTARKLNSRATAKQS